MSVVIITPDPSLSERIRQAVASQPKDWSVLAEHAEAEAALQELDALKPDVVVLDDTARAAAATEVEVPIDRFVKNGARRSHVLLLGKADSEKLVGDAVKAGVKGILARTDSGDLLLSALEAVSRGKPFFSPRATEIVLNRFLAVRAGTTTRQRSATPRELTRREREIVRLLADGKPVREIASALGISVKTVENHRANAMNKMGARQVSDLVRRAQQDGVLS